MAWLSLQTGQSAADLLAVPATVYAAIKDRIIDVLIAREAAQREREHLATQSRLMATLKGGG